jgi:hypothetical protein
MKWPNALDMPTAIAEQLEQRMARFIEEDQSEDGGSDGAAVHRLIIDLYSIATANLSSEDADTRIADLISRGLEWDTEDPRLVNAQKYINRLFAGRFSEAHNYIDRARTAKIEDESIAGQAAISKVGAIGGKKAHEAKAATISAALRYYENNRSTFRNKVEAACELAERFPPVAQKTYYRRLCSLRKR